MIKKALEKFFKEKTPGLDNIEHADFIRTRDGKTRLIILNFLGKSLPNEMRTPDITPVRPWINKPLKMQDMPTIRAQLQRMHYKKKHVQIAQI